MILCKKTDMLSLFFFTAYVSLYYRECYSKIIPIPRFIVSASSALLP